MPPTKLSAREQRALMLIHGFFDGRHRTLAETGDRMGVSRERVRQIMDMARRRLAGDEDASEMAFDADGNWARMAVWDRIDGFEDIVARPMITAQGVAERMPELVGKVRAYRVEQARSLAFEALWPGEDDYYDEEKFDLLDDEERDEEILTEREIAYRDFELSPAQLALVDRTEIGHNEVIDYLCGPGWANLKGGMPGIALPFAFKLRIRAFRFARRDQVKVVLEGKEAGAVESLAIRLSGKILSTPDKTMFSDFLDFWDDECGKYVAHVSNREAQTGAIALAWPSIVERGDRVLLDADDFRARRDALIEAEGDLVVQEMIWAGFGAWTPPEGMVTAVAEFRPLHDDAAQFQDLKQRRRRRIAAAHRRALAEADLESRLAQQA